MSEDVPRVGGGGVDQVTWRVELLTITTKIRHSSGADRCLDLADQPETLLDAPDLGPLNLVQCTFSPL